MPTYGYRCETCGTEFDLRQSMSDEPKANCPSCGNPARRLFYPAGIVFKGTGFYKTDSRSSGGGSGRSGSSSASSASPPASDATPAAGESKSSSGEGGTTTKESAGGTAPSTSD